MPLVDEDLDGIENKIENVLKENVSFIEFRFDYLKDFDNVELILEKISKYNKHSIYTLRPITEGGKYAADDSKRIILLKKLALARPMLLDLEYNT
ncbi:MAG: type I 3-dehydroquinate dehydratase, partial [Nitrosopumilus sp.]|nr:type I 3-dehydroquinate dehydratase [Nitrosopumilus sp.]